MNRSGTTPMELLYVAPHQWGPGRVHVWNPEGEVSFCGTARDGARKLGLQEEVTCKACLSKLNGARHWKGYQPDWLAPHMPWGERFRFGPIGGQHG